MVVWGDYLKSASNFFLRKIGRHGYEFDRDQVVEIGDCTTFGKAEMSVDVLDGFFAPEMSPWMSWYVNLWFGEPAWDECEIRRRRLIAYTVQVPLVAVWVSTIFVVRLVYASLISGVLLRKNVPWEAVVRPFVYDTADIWYQSDRRWEGNHVRRLILVPSNQLMMIAVSVLISILVVGLTGLSFLVFPVVYAVIVTFSVVLVSSWLEKWFENNFKRYMAEREERLRAEALDRSYSELLCTTVPADGTLRTKRQGFKNNVVITFQDFKSRVCRPAALH